MNEDTGRKIKPDSPLKVFLDCGLERFSFDDHVTAFRYPVVGGWVVATIYRCSSRVTSSTVFVPDRGNYWEAAEYSMDSGEGDVQ